MSPASRGGIDGNGDRTVCGPKLSGEELDRMERVESRQAVYLAAAREPRRDEEGLRLGPRGGDQDAMGQGLAHLEVALLVAERAGHPAAPRVELADLEARD